MENITLVLIVLLTILVLYYFGFVGVQVGHIAEPFQLWTKKIL